MCTAYVTGDRQGHRYEGGRGRGRGPSVRLERDENDSMSVEMVDESVNIDQSSTGAVRLRTKDCNRPLVRCYSTGIQNAPDRSSRLADHTTPRLGPLHVPCPAPSSLVPRRDVRGHSLPHQHRRARCCLEHVVHALRSTVSTLQSERTDGRTSILSAEHSLYARAPMEFATRWASAVVTNEPAGACAPEVICTQCEFV